MESLTSDSPRRGVPGTEFPADPVWELGERIRRPNLSNFSEDQWRCRPVGRRWLLVAGLEVGAVAVASARV